VFAVEAFVEKPDEGAARKYVENGYFWNCGTSSSVRYLSG